MLVLGLRPFPELLCACPRGHVNPLKGPIKQDSRSLVWRIVWKLHTQDEAMCQALSYFLRVVAAVLAAGAVMGSSLMLVWKLELFAFSGKLGSWLLLLGSRCSGGRVETKAPS